MFVFGLCLGYILTNIYNERNNEGNIKEKNSEEIVKEVYREINEEVKEEVKDEVKEEVKDEVKEEVIFKLYNNLYDENPEHYDIINKLEIEEFNDCLPPIDCNYVEVIYNGENIIGYIFACDFDPHNEYENDNIIYVATINIIEEYRNKGYGTRLLDNLYKHYGKPILLDSFENNVKFYEKNGFKKYSYICGQTRLIKY